MFDQNTDKTLQRAENRAVQHHRHLLAVVLGNIGRIETPRHGEIELNGTQLPDPVQAVTQRKFNLGPVKGTLTRLQFPVKPFVVECIFQRLLGAIPHLVITNPLLRAGRELDQHIVETKILVDLEQQIDEVGDLGQDLPLGAEDVRIVLHKVAHPHQAMQRAGRLIAMTGAELSQA